MADTTGVPPPEEKLEARGADVASLSCLHAAGTVGTVDTVIGTVGRVGTVGTVIGSVGTVGTARAGCTIGIVGRIVGRARCKRCITERSAWVHGYSGRTGPQETRSV